MIMEKEAASRPWQLAPAPYNWRATLGNSNVPAVGANEIAQQVLRTPPTHSATPAFSLVQTRGIDALNFAQSSTAAVVFEGELHNRDYLLARLSIENKGRTFTDSEILLACYTRWGEDVPQHLKGVFAAIIWDPERNTLLAFRDRIGTYPLFYARSRSAIHFSSSIDALLRHPDVSRALDAVTVATDLASWRPTIHDTHYQDVKRIAQAHVLRLKSGTLTISRYWRPVPLDGNVKWAGGDYIEQFDELLNQSVTRSLTSGAAAIFLSGGIDSVSVAASASEIQNRDNKPPLLALSTLFEGPDCNEETMQRSVASRLGLPIETVDYGETSFNGPVRAALDVTANWPMPILNLYMPPYNVLARRAVDQGYKTILTGGGGDEWLTVSPFYNADLIKGLHFVRLARLIASNVRSHNKPQLSLLSFSLWDSGIRPLAHATGRSLRRKFYSRAPKQYAAGYKAARAKRIAASIPGMIADDPALRSQMVESQHDAPFAAKNKSFYFEEVQRGLDHLFTSTDMEEAFEQGRRLGLSIRQPYWDADLVDFLIRTPPEVLHSNGRSKGLVRSALERKFPGLGFGKQRKVGALNFANRIILKEASELWNEIGGASALAELGIVEPDDITRTFRTIAEQIPANGVYNDVYKVWHILNMETWVRNHIS